MGAKSGSNFEKRLPSIDNEEDEDGFNGSERLVDIFFEFYVIVF